MMATTIRDVAQKVGVSIATVSKVFNGYTDVNPQTKARILQAAQELDYTPNMAARTLSSKKQQTIALILNELNISRMSTMPLEVLGGVYQYTEDSDYEFVFYGTSSEKQQQKTFNQFCNEHNITGVVIQGLKISDPYYQQIQETKIPVVIIDITLNNPNVGTVSTDNVQASREVVEYLFAAGHQQVGMINGSQDATVSIWRETGYRQAFYDRGIIVEDAFVCYADYDEEVAYRQTKELLKRQPQLTALFCASDLMAIGAIRGIQELGLSVPKDISVIGFDDIILDQYVTPKLSSVSQDMKDIGYQAGKLLTAIIEKRPNIQLHEVVPHQLQIRESVRSLTTH